MDVLSHVCSAFLDLDFKTRHADVHRLSGGHLNAGDSTTSHSMCTDKKELYSSEINGENTVSNADSQHATCHICDKHFSWRYNLNKHIRNVHGRKTTHQRHLTCPLCDAKFTRYNDLDNHLRRCHEVKQEIEEMSFNSLQEFNTWKANEETIHLTHYIIRTSNSKKKYFICHQSGCSRPPNLESSKIHWRKSLKLGYTCPARILVNIERETVKVQYVKTHIGHKLSATFLRLTKEDKCFLANRIKEGVPFKQILHDIQMSNQEEGLKRIHLTSTKDLFNIKKALHIDKTENLKNAIENISTLNASRMRVDCDEKLQSINSTIQGLTVNMPGEFKTQVVGQMEKVLELAEHFTVLSSQKNRKLQLGETQKSFQSNANILKQRFVRTKHMVRKNKRSFSKSSVAEKKEIKNMLVKQTGEGTSCVNLLHNKHDMCMTNSWLEQIVDHEEIIDLSTSNIDTIKADENIKEKEMF